MLFTELRLAGAYLIELEPHTDDRGFFARSFCEREFLSHGLPDRFPQCNISRNDRRGTLRGMHYDAAPTSESKLVRCSTGAIYDVIVDLRRNSATYRQCVGVDLTAKNGAALFVPAGFAHGFLTQQEDTDVFYHMGDTFRPESARGFRWNDPAFQIEWPFQPTTMSERDANYANFEEGT